MTFSEIVDELQGDKGKGMKMLVEIAKEQQQALHEMREALSQVEKSEQKYNSTMKTIEMVCQHLKVEPHFIIREGERVYKITAEFEAEVLDINYEC